VRVSWRPLPKTCVHEAEIFPFKGTFPQIPQILIQILIPQIPQILAVGLTGCTIFVYDFHIRLVCVLVLRTGVSSQAAPRRAGEGGEGRPREVTSGAAHCRALRSALEQNQDLASQPAKMATSQPTRAYDSLYDKNYTVSGSRDYYRDQARAGGFTLERVPQYGNFFSEIPTYPSQTVRFRNVDKVPPSVTQRIQGQRRGDERRDRLQVHSR